MATSDPTFVGQVASVTGGTLRIRLRTDIPTTLVLVGGESYRIGQIGGFFRIPIGYTHLYAICSQVGADAAPRVDGSASTALERDEAKQEDLAGYRWMTLVLFGEATAGSFERGVSQYPTVGDEVHFVTDADLTIIYGRSSESAGITLGSIASTAGIPAVVDLNKLVSRHSAIVGSTGAGKSNLVAVMLEALAAADFPSARVLVIDPHGEYAAVAPTKSRVFRINPGQGEHHLLVPFWALPFDELLAITFGAMQPTPESFIRDRIQELKREAAAQLEGPPSPNAITADSPVPFSIKRLWFELDDFERRTLRTVDGQKVPSAIVTAGDAEQLTSNIYEPYQPGSQEPIQNPLRRGLTRQLELARSRLTDSRYAFLFDPGADYSPTLNGQVDHDLDGLVASWIGHGEPLSILDVSDLPSDVATNVVGLLVRIVFDTLFWAGGSPVGGRQQPLLIVIDEAHRFLPEGAESSTHRILNRVAKEGRKYGVGLSVVTQRPSEIDATILSQCGTMVALRTTNPSDRSRVAGAFPDDLGGLVDLLPSLRTGEALLVGEAMFVPSRVRVKLCGSPAASTDPNVAARWRMPLEQHQEAYRAALLSWRNQVRGD